MLVYGLLFTCSPNSCSVSIYLLGLSWPSSFRRVDALLIEDNRVLEDWFGSVGGDSVDIISVVSALSDL